MSSLDFADIAAPAPDYRAMVGEYAALMDELDASTDAAACVAVVRRWDECLRRIDTWQSLVSLRFQQDTRDAARRRAREECDELEPKFTELAVRMMRRILAHPHLDGIVAELGDTARALWQAQVTTYDPAIEGDRVAELKLEAEYVELTASAAIEVRGHSYTLAEVAKFGQELERDLRHEARRATWQWFSDHGPELDSIYDEQVKRRTAMAHALGFDDFVGLGYQRMSRIDYGADEVARFRTLVRDQIVPLRRQLRRRQSQRLGLTQLYEWDLPLFDRQGNPRPQGDHDWMLDRAEEMFHEMAGDLGEFFTLLRRSHLLDLEARPGKGGGGFCTAFPTYGLPFIFANFNGSKQDVETFTHEVGHAYQVYESRHLPLLEYFWPTMESCEIHSMSLEFLTWPYMEKFFGQDAARFRQMHLAESLLFLPYAVAVDHFQHLVYQQPTASPAERHSMWQEMERSYLPDVDYGDMDYPAQGGRWQLQRHIYLDPFYYIDYALAQVCALQFWQRSREDFSQAMDDYQILCRRGGQLPFQALLTSAHLQSPFEVGALEQVVVAARAELGL